MSIPARRYHFRILRHFHFIDFEIWIRGLTFSKGNFLSRFQRFSCRRLRWKPSREWKAEYGKLLRLLRRWWKKKSAQRHEIKPRSTDFYVCTYNCTLYLFVLWINIYFSLLRLNLKFWYLYIIFASNCSRVNVSHLKMD